MENSHDELEKNLEDSNAKPMSLPLEFLKAITCDFSTEMVLGEGGYGVVYKGVLRSGKIIAVKKLFEIRLKEESFQNEVRYLIGIKHPNVVKFVGYCAESKWEAVEMPSGSGKHIFAEIAKRLLCFEYVSNKSLDKHISDESSGLEWILRYKIMKGICDGLHFLHDECRMVHLDLKPENILMDSTMTPKIADFGLSRIFGEQQSRIVTDSRAGTCGYMASEYLNQGIVSTKADIFSLGVIFIEIITGCREYPYFQQDSPHNTATVLQQFTEKVLGSWSNKFVYTPKYKSMERYTQQVKHCITIALKCVHPSMEKRPTAKDIIEMIHAVDDLVHLEVLNVSKVSNPFASQSQLTPLENVLKTDSNVNQEKKVIVRGVLSVTGLYALDIPAMNELGTADPYVVLYLNKGESKPKTRVVPETLNPIWNQTFDFVVEDALHDFLIVEVWNHAISGKGSIGRYFFKKRSKATTSTDRLQRDLIGRCTMTFTRAILEGKFQDTYALQGAESGNLNLHLKWTPQRKYE